MLMGSTANDFVGRIGRALEDASKQGINITAGAGDLEFQHLARRVVQEPPPGRPRHLESPPGPRDPGSPDGSSRLCYFLDGVQSSREVGRIGAVPVVVATSAAAIVNRCDRRFKRMDLDGPPAVVRAVILPRGTNDAKVEAFWGLLLGAGLTELGPEEDPYSAGLILDSTEYGSAVDPADYVGMRERAFGRVRTLRERLETELLRRWEGDDRVLESEDDWIAVDGQLPWASTPTPRAIGVIKSVSRPEFVGGDVAMLLDLEPGMRTTSFVPGWQVGRAATDQRTSWYVRVWPPQQGAYALGSLMRIEAPRHTPPEAVDEITRWILAERAPLAKPDPRWPAMIYPIHYVEKVLKPLVQGSERAYSRLERQVAANGRI
jgi:hypothetical protein